MLRGFARIGIMIAFVVVIAAGSVSAFGLLLDTTQKLTVAINTPDDTFYADLTGDCDDTSVNCM